MWHDGMTHEGAGICFPKRNLKCRRNYPQNEREQQQHSSTQTTSTDHFRNWSWASTYWLSPGSKPLLVAQIKGAARVRVLLSTLRTSDSNVETIKIQKCYLVLVLFYGGP